MKKIKRLTVGLLLLPLCYGVGRTLLTLLFLFREAPEGSWYFLTGFFGYLTLQWIFFKPMRTYVFGHELSHAIAAWLSGAKVKEFHVSKSGGHVKVTKSNVFVALAPYVIPLYALLLWAAYAIAGWIWDVSAYRYLFLSLFGACIGFHGALTVHALRQDQPDLKMAGQWLSGIIIFLGNAVVVGMMLAAIFPRTVPWRRLASLSWTHTVFAVQSTGKGVEMAWQEGRQWEKAFDKADPRPRVSAKKPLRRLVKKEDSF